MGQGLGDLGTDIVGLALHNGNGHRCLQNSVGTLLQIVHRDAKVTKRQVGVGVHLGAGAGNGSRRCHIPAAGLVAAIGQITHGGSGQSRAAGDIPHAALHQGDTYSQIGIGAVVPVTVDHLEGDLLLILIGDAIAGNRGIGILARVDQLVHRVVHGDGLAAIGGAADGIAGDADLHIVLTARGQGLGNLGTDIVGAAFHSRSGHGRLQFGADALLQIVHRNGVVIQRRIFVGIGLFQRIGNSGGRRYIPAAGLVTVIGQIAHGGSGQRTAAVEIPLTVLHQGDIDSQIGIGAVAPVAVDHLEGDHLLIHIGDAVATSLTADNVRTKGCGKGVDLAAAGTVDRGIDGLGRSGETDVASAAVPVIESVAAERGGGRAGDLITGDVLGALLLALGEGNNLHRGRNGTRGGSVGSVAD